MGNSKVIFGNETLIDLTGDTVTSDTLLAGTTAHNRSGEQIVGTATVPEELDDLTDVTLTRPAEGDLLQRNGNGKWVNSAKIPQKVAGLQKTGCVNLLNCTADSQVISGVTVTRNADGSYTLNGTNTSSATESMILVDTGPEIVGAGTWRLVGCPAGFSSKGYLSLLCDDYWHRKTEDGNGLTFTAQTGVTGIMIRFLAGATFNGEVIKPMITPDLSATYDDYQPYSMTNRGLTEAVVKSVRYDTNLDLTAGSDSGAVWTKDITSLNAKEILAVIPNLDGGFTTGNFIGRATYQYNASSLTSIRTQYVVNTTQRYNVSVTILYR